MSKLADAELEAMAKRFADHFGCPKSLRDLSYAPWVEQLKADAVALLAEVRRLRREDQT
jgi:hypothetical protein